MKRLIILIFVFLSMTGFAQINNMVKATKVSSIDQKSFDPGCCPVFRIISGKVSATPISIPSQNNQPVILSAVSDHFSTFSNTPKSSISSCSLVNYRDKQLRVHISYIIHTDNNKPVWAGAWFYDKNNNAADVGYIPQEITKKPSGDVDITMKFNKFPITTEYLKVMLLQDGKEIAVKSFKAPFFWKSSVPTETNVVNFVQAAEVNKINMEKVAGALPYVPDLEITAVKVVDTNDNILPYESGCSLRNKMIFITNIGTRESSPCILSVGYYRKKGNRGRYIEVKRFSIPSLLPGIETWRQVILPDEADNIKADLIIRNTNYNGETNLSNNSLEKNCVPIK